MLFVIGVIIVHEHTKHTKLDEVVSFYQNNQNKKSNFLITVCAKSNLLQMKAWNLIDEVGDVTSHTVTHTYPSDLNQYGTNI